MSRFLIPALILLVGVMERPMGSSAQMAHNCASTRIVSKRMPVGPAAYQSGRMTLANGATLALTGPPNSARMISVRKMRSGDPVNACYGPLKHYADAPPSRALTIVDKRTGSYVGGLIGSWPGLMP